MGEIGWKEKIFHASPSVIRNLLATIRGRQIERLRCGNDFEELVEGAMARDSWDSNTWQKVQKEQLAKLLLHARNNVPYYRNYWDHHSLSTRDEDIMMLSNWPILEKETVRANAEDFISVTSDRKKMKVSHTSGSTGTPVNIWWTQEVQRKRWAIFEARHRRWYGVRSGDPFALLGGRMVTPVQQKKPPFWVWNAAGNQLYMSSYHLSKYNIPFYVNEMKRRRVRHIYAYTSSIFEIANIMLEQELVAPGIEVVVTQAEPVYDHQRKIIEKAFNCPVRESYGMAEMVTQAGECESGNLHLWPEYGVSEVDNGSGKPVSSGSGGLIATGLLNYDMPLIRYRTGDRVNLASTDKKCSCGRGLPILENIEGRIDDVLLTRDGRKVGRLSTVFKSLPIIEAQTIQHSLDYFTLKIVPDKNFNEFSSLEIIQSFKERMGNVEVNVELLDAIPRGANGKFRAVLCEIGKNDV